MARTSLAVQEQFEKLSGQRLSVNKVSVANTTILNRAQISDLANDASLRLGIERIQMQRLFRIFNETTSTGQNVFGVIGDTKDQIRVVGSALAISDAGGQQVALGNNAYVEITFFGTGLNLLYNPDNAGRDLKVAIDGGSEADVAEMGSTVLKNRNYSVNEIIPLYSGQSLGVHTVKLRNNSANDDYIYGFEVINETAGLSINPGSILKNGKKFNLSAIATSSYNSGFESGTLGTRGGRVVAYLKSDGTIGKAVNPANASVAYMSSADHTNEELIRKINFREFGSGRTDDYSSSNNTPATRAGVLEDGTATLLGTSQRSIITTTGYDSVWGDATSAVTTITFVGTGLDIFSAGQSTGTYDTHTVQVDGVTATTTLVGSSRPEIIKICSGLPYGTHIVNITKTSSAGNAIHFVDFLIYGPKKPALPVNAAELGEYYVMADFVGTATAGVYNIATGVLRKDASKEIFYSGTWTPNSATPGTHIGAMVPSTVASGAYLEYTFFGTGFEFRSRTDTSYSGNVTVSIDGNPNWSGYTSATTGGYTIVNSTTGQIAFTGANALGSAFRITGLPLAKHTVRFTNNAALTMLINTFDVVTPVHFPKINNNAIQNTLSVGSCGIGDLREPESEILDKAKTLYAAGVTATPTTTSTSAVSLVDMALTYESEGEWVEINHNNVVEHNTLGSAVFSQIYVDGKPSSTEVFTSIHTTSKGHIMTINHLVYLPKGTHQINVFWRVQSGTGTSTGVLRTLSAQKIGE